MNKITETQLESTQLKRLAAQRQLYTDAKTVQKIQIGLNVLGPPILAVLVNNFCMLPVYAACCGIILTFLNILGFTPWRQSLKKKAAGIQELFDCDVLKLNWRELKTSARPEVETVEKYDLKYKRKNRDYSKLKNWYSKDVGELPVHLARIACQRENCWWDGQLRRRYARSVIWALAILTVLTLYLGIKGGFTLEKLILVVVTPLTPTFVLGIQQYKDNIESVTRLDELRKYAEGLWEKAWAGIDPEELTQASRDLQDEIYNNRRKNPLILDRFYEFFKKRDEELMNKTASELAKEARVRLP